MREIASKSQLRSTFLRRVVVTVPLILLLGFASGRLAQAGDANRWYAALDKPALVPPDWAFPVAWSVLYVLLGVAIALVWNARGSRWRGAAIAAFAVQMLLNLSWTPLFFGAHRVSAAMVLMVALLAAALLTTWLFGRVRTLAAWLMVPYLAWLCVAAALNWQIDRLNPDAEGLAAPAASTQIML